MNKTEYVLRAEPIQRETVVEITEMGEYDVGNDQRGVCLMIILVVFWLLLSGLMIWKIMLSE